MVFSDIIFAVKRHLKSFTIFHFFLNLFKSVFWLLFQSFSADDTAMYSDDDDASDKG